MGNLIRRNKTTPVEVHRAPGDPEVIDVSGAPRGAAAGPAPSAAPVSPNVTQNIFYISAPPGQSTPPPSQPAPPPEVHYHTTVHHAPIVRTRRKALSFLGSAAIVLGGLACAAAYTQQSPHVVQYLAVAGLIAGALAMLYAMLFGGTGRLAPALGLLISAAGYGFWLHGGGKLPPELDKAAEKIRGQIPAIDLDISGPKTPTPAKPAAPTLPATPADPQKQSSLFDFPENPPLTPSANSAAPLQTVDIQALQTTLESARLTAAKRLGVDYASAKSALDQADADLKQARANYAIGSAEVMATSQRRMTADSSLKAIEQQLRSDPAVVAAEQSLKAAHASSSGSSGTAHRH